MHVYGWEPQTPAVHGAEYSMRISAIFPFEPFVYQRLKQLVGTRVVVDTVRGSQSGNLVDVQPDHIVVQEQPGKSQFLIRTSEVVWLMPVSHD